MTYYTKAGRMIRLIGWLLLAVVVVFGLSVIIPALHGGVDQPFQFGSAVVNYAFVLLLAVAYLVIGAAIKRPSPAGVSIVAAWIAAAFSLVMFPVGTVIGLFAIYYLVKGRGMTAAAV